MAEFCWDCFKKYCDKDAKKVDYVIAKDDDLDLCEGCGQYKPTVIVAKENSCFYGFEIFGLIADLIMWLFRLIGKFIKWLNKEIKRVGVDMALIRCVECKKEVSSSAASCPHCGCPLGGGGSVGNVAFEKRIEEYKKAGYKLQKRNGNTVKMSKANILLLVGSILLGIVMSVVFMILGYWVFDSGIPVLTAYLMPFICLIGAINGFNATISLTTTGKIEEVGNVLKKK